MLHGTYIGAVDHLRGHGALLRPDGDKLLAQFDVPNTFLDPKTPWPFEDWEAQALGYGWHPFAVSDFAIDRGADE